MNYNWIIQHSDVVFARTYMTLFGVRVDFYLNIKNRYGKVGSLTPATLENKSFLARRGLVLEKFFL